MKIKLIYLLLAMLSLGTFSQAIHKKHYKKIKPKLKLIFRRKKNGRIEHNSKHPYSRPHLKKKRVKQSSGTSSNWSGFASLTSLTNPTKNSVVQVGGTWSIPTVSRSSGDTFSSAWVGIDGFSNGTVEQIGTEHDWYAGSQSNYAWYEMYPNYAYQITKFPVNVGDSISATVVGLTNGTFVLAIFNNTQNVYTTFTETSSSAQQTSAEWIVEAPYSNGILPLANFSTMTFTDCFATINEVFSSINSNNFNVWVWDAITMASGSTTKAQPSALSSGGQSFSVSWSHT